MWMGQWLSSGSERTERRKRQREGNRAIRSRMRMGMDGNERSVQGDSASPVRGACSRGMAWYSTAPPTYTRPSQRYPTHTPSTHAHAGRQQSPADPVSRGTLPTAPAPTPRSCKRLRFFHGRTAARRQMGKWATVRVGIGMRCHPCVRHHRLLARALAAVACPGERGSDWINAILVPLARTRVCGCARRLLRWGREHFIADGVNGVREAQAGLQGSS